MGIFLRHFIAGLLSFVFISAPTFALDTKCDPNSLLKSIAGNSFAQPKLAHDLKLIRGATSRGPIIKIAAPSNTRNLNEITDLVVAEYNVLNLVEHVGKFERTSENAMKQATSRIGKPEWQTKGIAEMIKKNNPDIMVLAEVEDATVLSEFNERFLNSEYHPILIEGNDERGIDVAMLIKKDLPFDIEIRSNKNIAKSAQDQTLFSRDLPIAIFKRKGAPE